MFGWCSVEWMGPSSSWCCVAIGRGAMASLMLNIESPVLTCGRTSLCKGDEVLRQAAHKGWGVSYGVIRGLAGCPSV